MKSVMSPLLLMGTAAYAQDTGTAQGTMAGGTPVAPSNAAPERDARGIRGHLRRSDRAAGYNLAPGTPGAAPASGPAPTMGNAGDLPPCSRKVTDHCTQTYERNHGPAPKHANFIENVGDASYRRRARRHGRRSAAGARALRRDARARRGADARRRAPALVLKLGGARRGSRARVEERGRWIARSPAAWELAAPPAHLPVPVPVPVGATAAVPSPQAPRLLASSAEPLRSRARAPRGAARRDLAAGRRWLVVCLAATAPAHRDDRRADRHAAARRWLAVAARLVACSRASRTRDRRARRRCARHRRRAELRRSRHDDVAGASLEAARRRCLLSGRARTEGLHELPARAEHPRRRAAAGRCADGRRHEDRGGGHRRRARTRAGLRLASGARGGVAAGARAAPAQRRPARRRGRARRRPGAAGQAGHACLRHDARA